jgi:hypothetical protein
LQAALAAAGVACVDAGAALEALGRRAPTPELPGNALVRGLAAACAAADASAAETIEEPVVVVFLSAVAFRGLGRAFVRHLPLVKHTRTRIPCPWRQPPCCFIFFLMVCIASS